MTIGGSVATSFATGAGTAHFFGVIDLAGLGLSRRRRLKA
jgi:hypothetical protein